MTWLAYFILAFFASFLVGLVVVEQKTRKKKGFMVRMGGIAMIISFVLVVFANPELVLTRQIYMLLAGSLLVLFFGVLDDQKNFSWKSQLVFQLFLVALLIFSGFSIDYLVGPFGNVIRVDDWTISLFQFSIPVFSFIIVTLWMLSVMNAVNWADGVDGLSGGIGIVAAFSLFWISLTEEVNQPAIAIIAIILLGSILGFWWHNFPKAKIEAGTSGSYFIGFILASSAIVAGTKIATAMIVLAIPLVDLVWVIAERIRRNSPITKRDFRHLHYKLQSIGWSNAKIVISYMLFVFSAFVATSLASSRVEKFAIIGTEVLLIVLFLFLVSRRQ